MRGPVRVAFPGSILASSKVGSGRCGSESDHAISPAAVAILVSAEISVS